MNRLQHELQVTMESLEEAKRAKNKLARRVDDLLSQGQGFYDLADDELISIVKRLRSEVAELSTMYFDRSQDHYPPELSIKYFEHGSTPDRWAQDHFCSILTTDQVGNWRDYLESSTQCHKIVQAFLWRIITKDILDKAPWVDDEILRSSTEQIQLALDPGKSRTCYE